MGWYDVEFEVMVTGTEYIFDNIDEALKYWAFERDDSHVTEFEKGYVMRVYRECLR